MDCLAEDVGGTTCNVETRIANLPNSAGERIAGHDIDVDVFVLHT
jgi:hypothetical protein